MKHSGFIKKALLALVALVLIAFVLLLTLDLGFLRESVERQVREATGRSFEIDGDFSVRLGSELRIRATGVKLGNPEWAGDEQFLEADSFSAVIGTSSLFSGSPVIKNLGVSNLVARLKQNEAGQANWVFEGDKSAKNADAQLPFLLEAALIENASIEIQSPLLDKVIQIQIEKLEEQVGADDRVQVTATGHLDEKPFNLDGAAGPFSRLLAGNDIELEGSGNFGNISISGSAQVDNIWSPNRPAFNLKVSGPELAELTGMLGIEGLGTGDLSFTADGIPDDSGVSTHIVGNFGELKMDVTGVVSSLASLDEFSVAAKVSGTNFGRVARLMGQENWPESPFRVDTLLDFSPGGLEVSKLELLLAKTDVSVSGSLPGFPGIGGAALNVSVQGPDLAPFQKVTGLPSLPAGPFKVKGKLTTATQGVTDVQFDFELPFGKGKVAGVLGYLDGMVGSDLVFKATGNDASRIGQILELPGLRAEPWSAAVGLKSDDPAFFMLEGTKLLSKSLSLELQGKVGADSFDTGTDVQFSVRGAHLSDFQSLIGAETILPDESFAISGHAKALQNTWELSGINAKTGSTSIKLDGVLGKGPSFAGTSIKLEAEGSDLGTIFTVSDGFQIPNGPFLALAQITLHNDRLALKSANIKAGGVKLDLDADLAWPVDGSEGRFSIKTSGDDISRIVPELAGMQLDTNAFSIDAAGDWADKKINVSAGSVKIGNTLLTAKGVMGFPPDLSATNFDFGLVSPDLSRLGTMDGVRWKPVPVTLKSSFTGSRFKLVMDKFTAELDKNPVTGSFSIDFEPEVPEFNLRLSARKLDLSPFQADASNKKPQPVDKNAKLFSDDVLPMEMLSKANGAFSISADSIQLKGMTLRNNTLTGRLEKGALYLDDFGSDGHTGRLSSVLKLVPVAKGAADFSLSTKSQGLIFSMANRSNEELNALPAFDVDIDLRGSGVTMRELASRLNGTISVSSKGGRVNNVQKENAKSFLLAELLSAISPSSSKQKVIEIVCVATVLKVVQGSVLFDPGVAIQSEKLNIFATGKITLADEKIDLNFRTETRNATKVSASELVSPYVKLSGTLANPSVALDPKGTLLSGGAAYLSGGLSILAKKALGAITSSGTPCAGEPEPAPGG